MNPFTAEPFTSADHKDFIEQNLTLLEKEFFCAGYLWWPINKKFMNRYQVETGCSLFKAIHNGITVGHFSVWDDDKCLDGFIRVSRVLLYRPYRARMIDGNPSCYWIAKLTAQKAKELYPTKRIYGLAYDKITTGLGIQSNKGLTCFISAGFVEFKRENIMGNKGNILTEKYWLEYKEQKNN